MLLGVLFLVDDDGAVDEDIVEKEELAGLQFLAAGLSEDSLAHENSTCQSEKHVVEFCLKHVVNT